LFFLSIFLFQSVLSDGNVKDLTSDNFDQIIDGSKAAFVEFFAPWCGHCKKLAPEYEIVGDAFAKYPDVVIAKVDADQHKDLGGRFGIRGFPTLKFFPKGKTEAEDYSGGREANDIIEFINNKAGTRARVSKAPSDVTILNPSNFDAIVKDVNKHVLVEFYAPWCGHCKHLAPIWEKLASVFKNDPNVVIANVDADKHKDIGSKFGVSGFPTLKFFGKDSKSEGKTYSGQRELVDLVKYVNSEAGTKRTVDGRLDDTAGRVSSLDDMAKQFVEASKDKKDQLLKSAESTVASLSGVESERAQFYVKYMKAIASKGKDFVTSEKDRLSKLVDGGSLAAGKSDEFVIRKNILSQF